LSYGIVFQQTCNDRSKNEVRDSDIVEISKFVQFIFRKWRLEFGLTVEYRRNKNSKSWKVMRMEWYCRWAFSLSLVFRCFTFLKVCLSRFLFFNIFLLFLVNNSSIGYFLEYFVNQVQLSLSRKSNISTSNLWTHDLSCDDCIVNCIAQFW
jgi:hypothetical protein